jgi:phasin family protein
MADRKAKAGAAKVASAKRAAPKPTKAAQPAKAVKAAADRAVSRTAQTTSKIAEGQQIMTKDTIENIQANQAAAAERFQAVVGDVNVRAKDAMERGTRLLEEMTELTRGNVEALVASSKVAARGVETLGQEAAEYGRRSFEEASAAFKSFAEVKSATDFFKLQSDYARSAFDSLVTESSKISEQVIKLAGEVAEPITSRYSVAAERVKNIAA